LKLRKPKRKKRENIYDAIRRDRNKKYAGWVASGFVTQHQAHTLKTMEELTLDSFIFQYIDFPKDEESIQRLQSFADAIFDQDRCHKRCGEPSYLLNDEENMVFVVVGLRCGTENSSIKDTLSAVMLTEERIFLFNSKKCDGLSPSSTDSGYMEGVFQVPLKNILDVTIKRETQNFPHGSILFRVWMPDWLRTKAKAVVELMRRNEVMKGISGTWSYTSEHFPDPMEYELEFRTEDVRNNILNLLGILTQLGETGGFSVKNEFSETETAHETVVTSENHFLSSAKL